MQGMCAQARMPSAVGPSGRAKAQLKGKAQMRNVARKAELWTPPTDIIGVDASQNVVPPMMEVFASGTGAPGAAVAGGGDQHKPKTPPPDLPSLLLESRIVYLGMPLVSAVTELVVAELLYLQYRDNRKPMYLYINSTGCTRADGETVGFETEGMAIFDTMAYIQNDIHTVGVGVAIGHAAMLLSAGARGKRFMLPHATAMLHQPRVPPTGQRQATEIEIKWKEVLSEKEDFMNILHKTTGQPLDKLDADMQRPLYMQPKDCLEYGIIDGIVRTQDEAPLIDTVATGADYDKAAGLRVVPQAPPSQ